VAYYGLKTSPEHAGFCNGSFGHGFEIDDINLAGCTHPGLHGYSTALAVGEWVRADGKEFITAAALTMELMLRLTQIAGPYCCGRVRTHISDSALWFGGWSCQALGLDQQGILNASAIAGSYSIAGLRSTRSVVEP